MNSLVLTVQVWRRLPGDLKDKLLRKGLLCRRWYFDGDHKSFDPLKTKSWQSMFETTDKG